jgi:twitching motility two-component system response regulator PilH
MAVILIIDDSPTELHLFQNMLEKNGFRTLVADSGEEGIRQARTERPDCILMDVVMPGMNGFQATRKLTRDPGTANIPVIMITTKDQETDKIWGMRQGAVEYLVKPVAEKQLVAKINAVVAVE